MVDMTNNQEIYLVYDKIWIKTVQQGYSIFQNAENFQYIFGH